MVPAKIAYADRRRAEIVASAGPYRVGYTCTHMQTLSAPIRILCVDDHPLMREGIAAIIRNETDMLLVAEATGGREAIARFREHRPDVTLMDLRFPDISGIEALRQIRAEFEKARIIMLTTFDGDADIRAST